MIIPYVVDGEKHWDVFSRLLKDRIIFIGSVINNEIANGVVAQILFLSNQDPDALIRIYVNSPGGSVVDGMAIVDTIMLVPNPIETIVVGQASSMGAIIALAGDKGKRKMLPNSRFLIHQPLGGCSGQASDIQISAENILKWKKIINKYLSDRTGQPLSVIERDTDRDTIFAPEDALAYGLVDEIVGQSKVKEVQTQGEIEV